MSEFFVSLSSIEDVRQFVNAATCCPCEVDVLSGRYVIDAKSIMGLFSLDLSHPVKVEVHGLRTPTALPLSRASPPLRSSRPSNIR